MKPFLSNYADSDNESEDVDGRKQESDSESGSDEHPASILTRHHRIDSITASFQNQVQQVHQQLQSKLMQDSDQMELLGESPEFEAQRRRLSHEDEDDNGEDKRGNGSGTDNGSLSRSPESGKKSTASPNSRTASSASSDHEPPEKRPNLLNQEDLANVDNGIIQDEQHSATTPNEEASFLARSMIGKLGDEIQLPPEPSGQCSAALQERIAKLLDYTRRTGTSFVDHAERSKSFRNPSIYEKLIKFCNIDENGTNFPPEIYNPHIWGKESYYEELNKVQQAEMTRREKDRQTASASSAAHSSSHARSNQMSSSSQIGDAADRERKKSRFDTSTATHRPPVVQVVSGSAVKAIPATGALLPGYKKQ